MHRELNEVENGFIQRWLEQSLEIIMKNPLAWIFLMSMLSLSSLIPVNVFFKSFIGLWFMLVGIELTIHSEMKKRTFRSFIDIIIKASEGLLMQIYFKMIFYTLMFILFVIIKYTGELQNVNKEHYWISDVYWLYCLGLVSLAGVGFQIFTHLYSRFFNVADKRIVNFNCKLAAKLNYKVDIFFTVFIVFNIAIVSMFFPLLVVMLYPIACSLVYVAFKEIFLEQSNNKISGSLYKEVRTSN